MSKGQKIKIETPPILRPQSLYLEDLKDLTPEQLRVHFLEEYQADPGIVDRFKVLVAYESVGSWGCDSSSWFLLRDKSTGDLFEVHGSHCSCYGFEGQFDPESTTVEYLKSDKFGLSCGGYDSDEAGNKSKIVDWLRRHL